VKVIPGSAHHYIVLIGITGRMKFLKKIQEREKLLLKFKIYDNFLFFWNNRFSGGNDFIHFDH